jgi:hypothetical protein
MGLGSGIRKKPIPDPGSRGQKGTRSRIRIRNTVQNYDNRNFLALQYNTADLSVCFACTIRSLYYNVTIVQFLLLFLFVTLQSAICMVTYCMSYNVFLKS